MAATRPRRLREGSTVALISPSWGGPHAFPEVYARGVSVLEDEFGLKVVAMEHTCTRQSYLRRNPKVRADDINNAFLDPEIDGIIATIGGDDSIRTLPGLRTDEILDNPKVLMGFSDTTTLLTHLSLGGMVTFYGPSVMAGISQMRGRPREVEHLKSVLFHPRPTYDYVPSPSYSEGYPDWSDDSAVGRVNRRKRSMRWKALQGEGRVSGELFGGCLEVLDLMRITRYWPPKRFWEGKVLFLETSESTPSPSSVKTMLRNYGIMGALESVSAVLFGRLRGFSAKQRAEMERTIRAVVSEEVGRPELPVVVNMDFGHTDPQMVLPLGVRVEVDIAGPGLRLLEPAVR
ncbi:MAG: LD-carboxypeptidase [Methanomassiliicoccus sp.]|nr:LD-carboxypeptidase [Methanomassiliicoccus sp.]